MSEGGSQALAAIIVALIGGAVTIYVATHKSSDSSSLGSTAQTPDNAYVPPRAQTKYVTPPGAQTEYVAPPHRHGLYVPPPTPNGSAEHRQGGVVVQPPKAGIVYHPPPNN